jgi:hypothetical protein
MTDDTVLTLEQQERVEALKEANGVLRTNKGAFGGSEPPGWVDLISVAQYILYGIGGLTDLRDMDPTMQDAAIEAWREAHPQDDETRND